MSVSRLIVVLFSLVIFYRIDVTGSQVNPTTNLTRFASIKKLYPKISIAGEVRQWRMTRSENLKDHPCKRECVANQQMTCYYYMVVHYDETMGPACLQYLNSDYHYKYGNEEYINPYKLHEQNDTSFADCKYADNVPTKIMVVNGQLPGFAIELCYGDTVVADVINSLHEGTTIHWHGLHQTNTPHMDGVPYVTQYPIEPGQAFRYRFEVDNVGTHWWHSHTQHQRAFGLAGPMIVRVPRQYNPHAHLYDFDYTEHAIVLQDWIHEEHEDLAKNILVNGLGRNILRKTAKPTLYAKFMVARGGRYRFRIIYNGVTNCPISLSIDQHHLLIISSDGNDIEPIEVQKLYIHGGERIDFVLNANRKVDNYWMRIKGYSFCETVSLYQAAILHYMGADRLSMPSGPTPSYRYEPANAVQFNGFDVSTGFKRNRFGFNDIKALTLINKPTQSPDLTLYINLNVKVRDGIFLFQIDDITFTFPPISMLQTRNLGIGKFFCNQTQHLKLGIDCMTKHCKCTNVLQVPAFKHIEIVATSKSDTAHPLHLHGYTVRVVGMGILGIDKVGKIEEIDRHEPLPRRLSKAPRKDTIQVPAFGYTIIRFYTNNPGYWILHCHISTHSETGMSAVIRVGEDTQMKMCPVSNCGLCNTAS